MQIPQPNDFLAWATFSVHVGILIMVIDVRVKMGVLWRDYINRKEQ